MSPPPTAHYPSRGQVTCLHQCFVSIFWVYLFAFSCVIPLYEPMTRSYKAPHLDLILVLTIPITVLTAHTSSLVGNLKIFLVIDSPHSLPHSFPFKVLKSSTLISSMYYSHNAVYLWLSGRNIEYHIHANIAC